MKILLMLCLVASVSRPVLAQTAPAAPARLEFEVASVKENKSGSTSSTLGLEPGGRIIAKNVVLRQLIRNVYGLQGYQMIGGPDWLESARFDIEAKAGRDYPPQGDGPAPELLAMMKSLMEDRFKLKVHADTRDTPIYALVMAKPGGALGPQMQQVDIDCAAAAAKDMAARREGGPRPQNPGCGARIRPGRIEAKGSALSQFSRGLSQFVGRMVVDKTGLQGVFDITLDWAQEQSADATGPSIFTAVQEQLGLRLDAQRGPVEVLVIDSAEMPTPD